MAKLSQKLRAAIRRSRERSSSAIPADDKLSCSPGLAGLQQLPSPKTQPKMRSNDAETPGHQPEPVGFLSLPGELRNIIYELVLVSPGNIKFEIKSESSLRSKLPGLLQTNRQIRKEASSIYFLDNQFWTGRTGKTWRNPYFPMEAFLKRTGASRYEKSVRVHCEVPNIWGSMPYPDSWEQLVARASHSWMLKAELRDNKVTFPGPFDPFDFEIFIVLVVSGTRWREALLAVNFLHWLAEEHIQFEWVMSMTASTSEKPRTAAVVRFRLPASKPVTRSKAAGHKPRTWVWVRRTLTPSRVE